MTPLSFSDEEIIQKAHNAKNGAEFSLLWAGDAGAYDGDDSRADCALCAKLAFWVGPDPERIDRLFRRSGFYREKWDRNDYRERTIAKALEGVTEFYSHGGSSKAERNGSGPETQRVRDREMERMAVNHNGTGGLSYAEVNEQDPETPLDTISWPDPPDEVAFHGLAGDIVRAIEPHTEADPVALLVQFLVAFGSVVGRGPH